MNKLIALIILEVYLPLCVLTFYAAATRIFMMCPKANKRSWSLMYVVYSIYSVAVVIYILQHPPRPDELEVPLLLLLGIGSIAANLALTQKDWQESPPAVTQQRVVTLVANRRSTDLKRSTQ
jgi:hypothetical protein